jgi:hypothetical protein
MRFAVLSSFVDRHANYFEALISASSAWLSCKLQLFLNPTPFIACSDIISSH